MKSNRKTGYWFRVSLGIFSILGGTICLIAFVVQRDSQILQPLIQFSQLNKQESRLKLPSSAQLKNGDPIFARVRTSDAVEFKLVGMVRYVDSSSRPNGVYAYIDWNDPSISPIPGVAWQTHESPKTLEWVLKLMLPPEKRRGLLRDLFDRIDAKQEVLINDLEPLLINSLRDLTRIMRERFEQSVRQQRPDISELVVRYQGEIFEKKFIPLAKSEILPIVVRRSSPLLNDIGKEMFAEASVWRFGWRAIYDASPLPDRDLVAGEFRRFAQKSAIPIIEKHTDEIVELLVQISSEVARNPKIKQLIRESATEVFRDPAFRKITGQIFEDVFSDVDELTSAIELRWAGVRGQRFKQNMKDCIEPWFNKVGAEIFGTPQNGLTPEFVAALRTQVLEKDRRWITVDCRHGYTQLDPSYTAEFDTSNELFPANLVNPNKRTSIPSAELPNDR